MVSSATPRALLDEEVGSLAGRRANWMDVWLRGRVGGSVNGVLGGWVIGSLNGWVGEWSVGWVSEWLAEGAGLTNCNGPSTATPRPARRANDLSPPSSPNTCTATYAASSTSLAKNNTKKTILKSAAGTIVGSIFLGNPARAEKWRPDRLMQPPRKSLDGQGPTCQSTANFACVRKTMLQLLL